MTRYLFRRLFLIPPALLLVHFLGYSYAHLVRPLRAARNPYLAGIGDPTPLIPTYVDYLKNIFTLDFGMMPNPWHVGMIPILQGVRESLFASLGLMGIALTLSILIGILIGLSAVRIHPPGVARWLSSFSSIGLAMPSFYLGSLFFAFWFLYVIWKGPGSNPPLPFTGFGWDNHLVMPTLVLMARPAVQIAQVTATLMSEELAKQYVTAHRSLGSTWRAVRTRYALRNIIAPVIVTVAGALRVLVSELIVVEWLFDWPGLGNLLARTLIPSGLVFTSSSAQQGAENVLFLSPPVVAAVLSVFALLFLLTDLTASLLSRKNDPRLRAS